MNFPTVVLAVPPAFRCPCPWQDDYHHTQASGPPILLNVRHKSPLLPCSTYWAADLLSHQLAQITCNVTFCLANAYQVARASRPSRCWSEAQLKHNRLPHPTMQHTNERACTHTSTPAIGLPETYQWPQPGREIAFASQAALAGQTNERSEC